MEQKDELRLRTGISGMDRMLFGGVPLQNQVLVAGGPGSGKSLLCFDILYNCAKAGIPSLFVSFEDRAEDVIRNAKEAFGAFTDVDILMQRKMLSVREEVLPIRTGDKERDSVMSLGNVMADLDGLVAGTKAECVALDPMSLLDLIAAGGGTLAYRRSMVSLMANLKKLKVTAFMTAELPSAGRDGAAFPAEFFVFDGIIALRQDAQGDRKMPTLEIVKMRGSDHSQAFAPYEITRNGFVVSPPERHSDVADLNE